MFFFYITPRTLAVVCPINNLKELRLTRQTVCDVDNVFEASCHQT